MTRRQIDLYLRLVFLSLGTLAAMLSLKTYISDSEFWAITASKQLGEPGVSSSIYMKFLFYGLLKPIYLLPLDSISHVLVARLEFAAIGALTAYVFYRVARLALEDDFWGLILTLVLVTSTYFLSQSFRVRSDNLSSLFALLIFWIVLHWSKRGNGKWILPAFGIFFLNLLLLVTTPKAFYFLLLGGLFASLLPFANLERRRKVLALGVAFLAPPFAIVSTVQFISLLPAFRWVERAALVAIEYFTDSFSGLSRQHGYLSSTDFGYVLSFLAQNPLHDLFFVASAWLWTTARRRHDFPELRAYLALFASSAALLILHNQKLPFFIYAILPMLVLGAGMAWRHRTFSIFASSRGRKATLALATISALVALGVTSQSVSVKANAAQMQTLKEIHSYLTGEAKGATYYDAIGLFPRLTTIYAFPSPNDRNNPVIGKVVENQKPDFIFYVMRTLNLEPKFGFFLADNYVDIGSGVWLKGIPSRILESVTNREGLNCRVGADDIGNLIKDRFADSANTYFLTEVDSAGKIRSVGRFEGRNEIEWRCEQTTYYLTSIEPRILGIPLHLRYLFGFEVIE